MPAGQHYLDTGGWRHNPAAAMHVAVPALDTLVLRGGGGCTAVQPLEDISTLASLSCETYMSFYLSRATLHHGRPFLLPPPRPRPFRCLEQARLAACASPAEQRAQRVFVRLSVSSSVRLVVGLGVAPSIHSSRRQLALALRVLGTSPTVDL